MGTKFFDVLKMLLKNLLPTAAAFAVLVAIGEAWYAADRPDLCTMQIEEIIVTEQVARAERLESPDVVITGDSSVLMGIDAKKVQDGIPGCRIESLATLGYAGPVFYSEIIRYAPEKDAEKKRDIKYVVFMVNNSSLNLKEQRYVNTGYERRILAHDFNRPERPGFRSRAKFFNDVISKLVFLQLPGSYGEFYGDSNAVRNVIRAGNGSMIDPNQSQIKTVSDDEKITYKMSDAFARRLQIFGDTVNKINPETLIIGITPNPDPFTNADTLENRRRALEKIAQTINFKGNTVILDTPASFETRNFASGSHLNKKGREIYTRIITEKLAEIVTCNMGSGREL